MLGRLSSTAIAVLAAPLQYRAIHRQQIAELANTKNFHSMIVLTEEARKELQWWVDNLQLTKGKTLINSQPQITTSTNASLEGWAGLLPRSNDRENLDISGEERSYVFGIEGSKVCNLAFSRLHPKAHTFK